MVIFEDIFLKVPFYDDLGLTRMCPDMSCLVIDYVKKDMTNYDILSILGHFSAE